MQVLFFNIKVMNKIKVTAQVVNRNWQKYIAKDWIIEVADSELEHFTGFETVEEEKTESNVSTKSKKNESKKKTS